MLELLWTSSNGIAKIRVSLLTNKGKKIIWCAITSDSPRCNFSFSLHLEDLSSHMLCLCRSTYRAPKSLGPVLVWTNVSFSQSKTTTLEAEKKKAAKLRKCELDAYDKSKLRLETVEKVRTRLLLRLSASTSWALILASLFFLRNRRWMKALKFCVS